MKPVNVEILMRGNLKQGLKDTQMQAELLDASLRRIGGIVGGVFTISQATQFVQTMIKVRGEVQDLSTSFEVLLGNKSQAESMFAEIARYAVDTPMQLGALAKGAQTLLAFNIEAETVVPTLKQLGDISMGNEEKFNALTLAFAQCQSAGKLMGQDLMQMINAGFNPLSVMAEKTGKSIGQLKEEMSAGAISTDMVAQAFADATSEGGKFHGMLDKMSKNTSGLISNFEGALEEMYNKIGQNNEQLINDAIKMGTTLVQNYEEVGKALGALVIAYGAYKGAVIATMAINAISSFADNIRLVAMFRKELGLATAMQQAFNLSCASNPYIALGMGIVALTGIIWTYAKANSAVADEQERVNKLEEEQAKEIDNTRTAIEDKIRILQDEVATEGDKRVAFEELKKLMPSVFGQYRTEKELLDDNTNARRAYNAELEREKQLKGEDNYKSSKDSLDELRRLQSLLRKHHSMVTSEESKEVGELMRKYHNEIQSSRGTLDDPFTAVSKLVNARIKATNSLAETARIQAHKSYISRLSGMSKEKLEKEKAYWTNVANSLRQSGKKWQIVAGEVAPISLDGIRSRLSTIAGRLKQMHDDAGRDYVGDAKKAWKKAEAEVAKIKKNQRNRTLYPTEGEYLTALRKAKEEEKKAKETYENLGGDTKKTKKTKKTTGLTPAEKANIKLAKKDDTERAIKAQEEAQNSAQIKAEYDLRASEIARRKEGTDKRIAQNKLNYDREMEANRLRRLAWIEELQKLSDLEFEASNPDWRKQGKKRPIMTEKDLSVEQLAQLKRYETEATAIKTQADADAYKEILAKYRTFEQQRNDVRKQFAQERSAIEQAVDEKGNKLSAEAIATALAEVAKKEKEAIKAINDAELSTIEKDSSLLVSLFEDASHKSISEIEAIIAKVRLLLDYLKMAKDEQGNATIKDDKGNVTKTITQKEMVGLGFTPAQLKTLSASPDKIKAITDALKALEGKVKSNNPFKDFAEKIKKASELLKKGDIKGGIALIGSAVAEFAPIAHEASDALNQIFSAGSEQGGSVGDELGTIIDVVSNLGKVAEGIFSGNPMAVLSGVAGLFSMANQAAERHRKALEAIMAEKIAQQREYNLLLLEQNLAYERGTTIFGTDTYAKAKNGVEVMRQAYAELRKEIEGTADQQRRFGIKTTGNKWLDKRLGLNYSDLKAQYAGLADVQVKTGHKRTGIFGLGKGKDLYSSLLDVYPQLIKANGEFDASLAKTILSSRELKDKGKEALQAMIDLSEQAKEAWESVKDYFSDIFGDLGQNLSTALREAFRSGTSSAQAFAKSVEEMLSKLSEQMIYSVTLAPLLERAQEQMLAITKEEGKSDEQKFANYVSILDQLMDDALAQQGAYASLMAKYDAMAKAKGLNLSSATTTDQRGQSTALQSVTQDSITRIEGLINAILLHNIEAEMSVENIAGQMASALDYLRRIEGNTATSAEVLKGTKSLIETIKSDIAILRRDGIKTL